MTVYAAGNGKSVTNYGQGELQYDPATGSFKRLLGGNEYIVGQNDEKFTSIKDEYQARYGIDPTGGNRARPDTIPGLRKSLTQRQPYEAPAYSSPYEKQLNLALKQAARPATYHKADYGYDQLWGDYSKAYLRQGQRATAEAISQAAALTGGVPSTAAVTAATQAGDNYAAALSELAPQLEATAYSRYQDSLQENAQLLELLLQADNAAYSRYEDQRDFDAQQWQAASQLDRDNLQLLFQLDETAYQRALAAEQQRRELATLAAGYGDFSYWRQLGVTPDLTAGSDNGGAQAAGSQAAEGSHDIDPNEVISLWLAGLAVQADEKGNLHYMLTTEEDLAMAESYCRSVGLPFADLFALSDREDRDAAGR